VIHPALSPELLALYVRVSDVQLLPSIAWYDFFNYKLPDRIEVSRFCNGLVMISVGEVFPGLILDFTEIEQRLHHYWRDNLILQTGEEEHRYVRGDFWQCFIRCPSLMT